MNYLASKCSSCLPSEEQIPIARYSQEGKPHEQYRESWPKVWSKNQMLSGIHFNFSFSDDILKYLFSRQSEIKDYDEFLEQAYLKVVHKLLYLRWLPIMLSEQVLLWIKA